MTAFSLFRGLAESPRTRAVMLDRSLVLPGVSIK